MATGPKLEETHAYRSGYYAAQTRLYGSLVLLAAIANVAGWALEIRTGAIAYVLSTLVLIPLVLAIVAEARRDAHVHADFQERHGEAMKGLQRVVEIANAIDQSNREPLESIDVSKRDR
jgi:hypothetical protein